MNLLEKLIEFYKEDPKDPFNIYALATEYQKTNLQEALRLFLLLEQSFPDYAATYYHLAKLYEKLNDKENAINTYKKGIEICTNLRAHHALKELKNAYNELLFED
ncbi:MAG: tetratricopeptide repeat protein [Cytophagales bacterium]|nr:MAG: tetratricopeptide repeat protein [Cytophagales bacterium]